MKFSQRLKEIRNENGLTQAQLAKQLSVTDTSIRDWENKGCQPSYEILCKLCEIFDVTAGQLLGIEDY